MDGTVFNIQKFCVNDGPGIRTTVFLKGCPLKCLWCHNPESQAVSPEIMFYADKCTGCGRCAGITAEDSDFVCFNSAKEICGKAMSAQEVIDEVLKDKIFYENSGGGMTLSGGEPLCQYDFALELLMKAKENGLHTAVETCGFISRERLKKISEYTDLFLFDYKETNSDLHKEYTGVGNETVISNLELLNRLSKQIILRCPIIPGYNDREEHFSGICAIADRLENILHVELEPYHSLGNGKYTAVNRKAVEIKMPDEAQKNGWLSLISEKCGKEVKFA